MADTTVDNGCYGPCSIHQSKFHQQSRQSSFPNPFYLLTLALEKCYRSFPAVIWTIPRSQLAFPSCPHIFPGCHVPVRVFSFNVNTSWMYIAIATCQLTHYSSLPLNYNRDLARGTSVSMSCTIWSRCDELWIMADSTFDNRCYGPCSIHQSKFHQQSRQSSIPT